MRPFTNPYRQWMNDLIAACLNYEEDRRPGADLIAEEARLNKKRYQSKEMAGSQKRYWSCNWLGKPIAGPLY